MGRIAVHTGKNNASYVAILNFGEIRPSAKASTMKHVYSYMKSTNLGYQPADAVAIVITCMYHEHQQCKFGADNNVQNSWNNGLVRFPLLFVLLLSINNFF